MERNSDHHTKNSAALVFSVPLARLLSTEKIPSTSVGVRKLRPSSELREALKHPRSEEGEEANAVSRVDGKEECGENDIPRESGLHESLRKQSLVVYKVVGDDGVERRMTKQEKKAHKNKVKEERAIAKKARKEERKQRALSKNESKDDEQSLDKMLVEKGFDKQNSEHERDYYQLEVSSDAIEEELAQLRGEKGCVLPVILSAPMAERAAQHGVLLCGDIKKEERVNHLKDIVIDEPRSHAWADAIKNGMKASEDLRSLESMRPMAYQIIPECWSRLRPPSLCTITSCPVPGSSFVLTDSSHLARVSDDTTGESEHQKCDEDAHASSEKAATKISLSEEHRRNWSLMSTRSSLPNFDNSASVVYEFIHRYSNLHVSCGAKFGCDFLLYDGPREERHAFAGLRVCCCSQSSSGGGGGLPFESKEFDGKQILLPIPSAYDLAGYVRALNTAGKLALLATVFYDTEKCRYFVLFVDLALEKILSAPTHQKKRSRGVSMQKRKDIGPNLAKKRG